MLVTRELYEGCQLLHDDAGLRAAFASYIKSGVWLDHFVHLQEDIKPSLTHEERIAREKGHVIYEYKTGSKSLVNFRLILENKKPEKPFSESILANFSIRQTGRRQSGTETKRSSLESITDCYISIDNLILLNEDELMSVMFGVIYPVFLTSNEYKIYIQTNDEQAVVELCESRSSKKESKQLTKSSRRAQEIFISCAANFDKYVLLQRLERRDWLETLESAFNDYHLPITVMDTNRPDSPFIYCNHAFETLYNPKHSSLVGKNLSILNGPKTEKVLLDQISDALIHGKACKVAITHYSAGKKSFLNLLALKPSGSYMFAVHCPEGRSTLSEDLHMVEDVLLLLSCIVQAPPPASAAKLKRQQSSWMNSLQSMGKALSQHFLEATDFSGSVSGGSPDNRRGKRVLQL